MDSHMMFDNLRRLSSRFLSNPLSNIILNEIKHTVQSITPQSLSITLPSVDQLRRSINPLIYTLIADEPTYHASLFAFRRRDDIIPLHDHPSMHGLIRVLRGSIRITSFSRIPSNQSYSSSSYISSSSIRMVYNGMRDVSINDGCIHLSPYTHDIHQVVALEDGTTFFDLLIPGYKEVNCSYFTLPHPLPQKGSIIELERCPTPPTYSCTNLPLDYIRYNNDY